MQKVPDDCVLPETHSTLHQLWKVISDPHSVDQVDRQLILLETFFSVTGDSVKVADLGILCKVIGFFMNKAELNKRYRESFHRLIDLFKNPPRMSKSSDAIAYTPSLVQLFTFLGCYLLQTNDKEITCKVLEIVHKMLRRPEKSDIIPVKACIQGIEVSRFMECLADFIAIADEESYHWTIHTALQISSLSRFSCWTLLTKNVIDSLLIRLTMTPYDRRSETLETTFQLLWNLLECTSHPEDWSKVPAPSKIALRSLRYVLREEAVVHSQPGQPINSLNNIAALTVKIMHLFPDAEYVLSGLIEDITFYATLTECVIQTKILPRFKNEEYLLQFKKLMLACLSLSPISSLSVTIFQQYKVAECLVVILSCCSTSIFPVQWCPEHSIDLITCTLPVVCALFECLQQEFLSAGLMKELVKFVVADQNKKNLQDDLTHTVLKTIFFICFCKTNTACTHEALREAGAISALLQLTEEIIFKQESSLTVRTQSLIIHSLIILTALMKNKSIQNQHAGSIFKIVNSLYQRILKPKPTDSFIDNRMVIAICNFAWELIVLNQKNVLKFINSGLVYTQIDILERSPFSVQVLYLSALVDISEHHESIPYLVSWRGRNGLKLMRILCKIWRTEEDHLQVRRSADGCIIDIEKPLMGKEQISYSQRECGKAVSLCDIFGSVRPKIYAIIQLLHRHKEATDLCEEHYRLGHNQLPCEDQITLQLVEAYLPLKMGEIWWEIRNKQEEVLPLERYMAETLADRYLNWSLRVQRAQSGILQDQDARLRTEEQHYYSLMRSTRLPSALEALREVMTIARSADRKILLNSNRRLREGIEASRAPVNADFRIAYPNDD